MEIEASPRTLTVTLGCGKKSSTGLNAWTCTLDELMARLSHHQHGTKDAASFIIPGEIAACPSPCRNHGRGHSVDCGGGQLHRLAANMRTMEALFVDLDGLDSAGLERAVAAAEASGLRFACYSTPSYAPPLKANCRFVFPLAEPYRITDPRAWKSRIWPALIAETGLTNVDPACSDAARLYYLPTSPGGEVFVKQGGERLLTVPDVRPLELVRTAPTTNTDVITALRVEAEYPDDIDLVERIAKGEPLAEEGGRHQAILRATMLLARICAKDIEVLMPSLQAMGDDEDHIAEAERMFSTAPVEDSPEVVAFRERLEEQNGTDQGFAKRFVRLCGDRALYITGIGWHLWDGQRWTPSEDAPFQLAASLRESYEADYGALKLRIAELTAQLSQTTGDTPSRKALTEKVNGLMKKADKFYANVIYPTQSVSRASSFLRAAAGMLATPPSDFDADPWALNCENGILDLKTHTLSPSDPKALCMKLAPTAYNPHARSELFERTLAQALPDPEVRAFFQRAIGYALTGSMKEDLLFILLGDGGNGKSTLLNAIQEAIGDYAGPAPKSLLIDSRNSEMQTYQLADLRGKRMVHMMELKHREYMDSSRLKSIVGGDKIIAARKYENQIAFTTEAKVFMPCNTKPRLNDEDNGAWRRIALIEFPKNFIADEDKNKELREQLLLEKEGILAWAVWGCLEWQRIGMAIPQSCKDAVASYRREEDYIGKFVEDRIERGDGTITSARLYDAYRDWAQHEGNQALSNTAFTMKLRKHGFEPCRTESARMWKGIKGLIA